MKESEKTNMKKVCSLCISTALITCLVTMGSIKFKLEKYDNSNIFNDKNLKISEMEADELFSVLEEETGRDNLDNERDLILMAAIENPNLTEAERETIFKLVDIIEEMPYIDKRMAYANLSKLDICYWYGLVDDSYGDYNYNANKINIYSDNKNNDVLLHELIHSLFLNMNTYNLPKYFREGVTELLEDEYFSDEPYWESSSYPYEIAMVKILCDMVGSDTVLKVYTTGDMNEIETELNKYMDSEETKTYLKTVEKLFNQYEKENSTSIDYMSDFLEYTNAFFAKKYFKTNKVYEAYEYNKELLINMKNDDPGMDYYYYLQDNGYYVKPYFSKKLKEKNKKYYQKDFEGLLTVNSL